MATTNISPNHFVLNKLTRCSSNTTVTVIPTSAGIPGFAITTAADIEVRIPIEHPGDRLGLMFIADAVSSAAYYMQVDIAYGNNSTDPAWGGRPYKFSSGVPSTVDLAWCSFISTAVIGTVTASECVAYSLMIDTAQFACNFGGTSSAITDKNENFINVMMGQSSAATISGHSTANANVNLCNFVGAFSLA